MSIKGNIKWQSKEILKHINGIGQKKKETREASGIKSLESGHKVSPLIHSYRYYGEVLRTAMDLGNFAKQEYGVKDMTKIDGEIVKDFLVSKMEKGVTYNTLSNYASHINKISHGLRKIDPSVPDFSQAVKEFREIARDKAARIERAPRFYSSPGRIVGNLKSPETRLVGRLQYELGLRVAEARHIEPKQIGRTENGTYTLTVQGKGGYKITKELPRELGHHLVHHIKEHGKLDVRYERYRDELKEAVERTGQEWHGTHGMRHTYARERMEEMRESGLSREEALKEVAEMMGHHRPDITEVYLR